MFFCCYWVFRDNAAPRLRTADEHVTPKAGRGGNGFVGNDVRPKILPSLDDIAG